MTDCVFCDRIAAGEFDSGFLEFGSLAVVSFEPLNPVTAGHRLYVPVAHVADAMEDPRITGLVFAWAAAQSRNFHRIVSLNLITSVGAAATQSIQHLHVHAVPRSEGDGLHLPWTGQQRREDAQ